MNIHTKAILAGTLFTALLAGTSAIADGDDNEFFYENTVSTESVVINKVNYLAPSVTIDDGTVLSGRK